ncbi:MAG: AlpA family phage regulatory protein [Oxalobacteraceae bacterium]|jgi:predicted DNA-binding transcriptional regulator AlpA|nr:MAG: AlpA family phage regulatory protein [Oxalobacteraceae bacterium]
MQNPSDSSAVALPTHGFVRQSFLLHHVVPFSAATLWRNIKSGKFPAPVRLSARVIGWRVEDIRAWVALRS